MADDVKKMYEGYWESKQGLEKFEDYERNQILKGVFKSNETVLDLASGEGAVSEFLQSLGCEVTAFDISDTALKKAKARGVKTVQGDVEKKLPFKNESFDAVFWGDNVEHLFLPQKTAQEIYRVLKPGGRLVLSTPNMSYWRYRLYYLFHGTLADTEYYGKEAWEWEHIRFFNRNLIEKFLKSVGFKPQKFFGVSRRRIDKIGLLFSQELFGMVMVIASQK